MKKENEDIFDELFQSKLVDFEMDVDPQVWDVINNRLNRKKNLFLRPTLYNVAAAVLLLMLVSLGIWKYDKNSELAPQVSDMKMEQNVLVDDVKEALQNKKYDHLAEEVVEKFKSNTSKSLQTLNQQQVVRIASVFKGQSDVVKVVEEEIEQQPKVQKHSKKETINKLRAKERSKEQNASSRTTEKFNGRTSSKGRQLLATSTRRNRENNWAFGLNAGGVSAKRNMSVGAYRLSVNEGLSKQLSLLNAASFDGSNARAKTNIKHHMPVLFGLTVAHYFNDRIALQSGLTYTFLSSEWETSGGYHGEARQTLHMLGIPLSLIYKFAEWNKLNFYVSAGAMTEVNAAGNVHTKMYLGEQYLKSFDEDLRMKEWLWSVNARLGLSYPLVSKLSIYGEVGVDYYFENDTQIETIRTERPFNASIQFGLKFAL